jgi:murein DD-endopeptidase MepM/ murein hydrolase activator NlpD
MQLKIFFSKTNTEKDTLIMTPEKRDKTKLLPISRLIIYLLLLFIIILVVSLSALISIYRQHKQTVAELKKSNEEYLATIKHLEAENTNHKDAISEYKETIAQYDEEAAAIRQKLIQIEELERKVNSLIDSKDSSMKLSRGGSFPVSSSLTQDLDKKIKSLDTLFTKVSTHIEQQRRIPLILPCIGRISSTFGYRPNPFTGKNKEFHRGVDIANKYGTPIYASADGIVTKSGWINGYGYTIIIDHGNGYETLYAHNSKLTVPVGTAVNRGDKIAEMGSSGRATGPHSHFEIRLNSQAINPFSLIVLAS